MDVLILSGSFFFHHFRKSSTDLLLHLILSKIRIAVFFHLSFYFHEKDFSTPLLAIVQSLYLKCQVFNNCISVAFAHLVPNCYCSDPYKC